MTAGAGARSRGEEDAVIWLFFLKLCVNAGCVWHGGVAQCLQHLFYSVAVNDGGVAFRHCRTKTTP